MSNFTTNPYGSPKFRDITKQCTFSWKTVFDEITHGSLDNVHDGNSETYCAGHTNLAGSGVIFDISVIVPDNPLCMLLWKIGAGAQIASYDANRTIYSLSAPANYAALSKQVGNLVTGKYEMLFAGNYGMPLVNTQFIKIYTKTDTAGDFAINIYELKILELTGVF